MVAPSHDAVLHTQRISTLVWHYASGFEPASYDIQCVFQRVSESIACKRLNNISLEICQV